MSPDLGQSLIELVCQPPEPEGFLFLLMEKLAAGLGADFCLWSIALGQPWFWSVMGKQGRWEQGDFIEDLTDNLSSVQETKFWLTSENIPNLKSALGKNCRGAMGIRTHFQGNCNGLIIVGSFQAPGKIKQKHYPLLELQQSLGIINQLLLTTTFLTEDSMENEPTPLPPDLDLNLPSSSGRNPFEDSAILKVWYDASRQQLEQQKQWNEKLVNNIITVMSDQTRNPLATIRMGLEILRKDPPSPEKLQQRLAIIEQEWHKLNDINNKILQLRQLKQQPNTIYLQSFDILPLLKKTIDQQGEINQRIKLSYSAQVYQGETMAVHLEQIFQELLTNAQKFSVEDTIIQISLNDYDQTLAQGTKMIKLTFTNLTPTVDSKNIRYLFEPFYREQWVVYRAIAGIGLGLTIIKTLVEQLNGRIDVACEPTTSPGQSLITFTLLIPGSGAD